MITNHIHSLEVELSKLRNHKFHLLPTLNDGTTPSPTTCLVSPSTQLYLVKTFVGMSNGWTKSKGLEILGTSLQKMLQPMSSGINSSCLKTV